MNFKTYSGLNENSVFTQKPDSYRKFFGVIVFLSIVSVFLLAYTPEPTLVIENGRVIIGNGTVLEQSSVVVAGDSIYSVTQEPVDAPDARRINASGKTVLPGLIDAQAHLTIPPNGRDSTALVKHLEENIPTILNGFLNHGITTVRSTGDFWPWIRDLSDRVDSNKLSGPRIITSGPIFTAKGGHPIPAACGNDALEMGDEIGTLEEGKLADLIVVDENPLEDLSALEDVEMVIQGGEIVTSNSEY